MASPSSRTPRRRRLRAPVLLAAAAAVGVAFAVGLAVANEAERDDSTAHAYTGEVSSMDLPVIETPGVGSGSAEAAGVVVEESSWALGHVPIDIAVVPTWVLRNDGDDTVTLGEPHPEVRAGCCPGPITLSHRILAPGEEARLEFELAMHAGMDGWHDIAVHVPISTGDDDMTLELDVTGDFGGY